MRFASRTKKWVRAREIGVNLDDVAVLELLGRETVTMGEAAVILQNGRENIFRAMELGTLQVTSVDHGAQRIHTIKTDDLMEFAVNRPPQFRVVDQERAVRYAKMNPEEK